MVRTEGEELFVEYLRSRDFLWEYERPTGSTQVDFLVHTSIANVLCEVKDFESNAIDRTLLSGQVMGIDPFKRIRGKIDEARVQFRPFKGRGIPCVLILYNGRSASVTLEGFAVYGAMFGNLGVEVSLSPPYASRPHVDYATGMLKRVKNTTISAVAVLDRYRFNQPLLDREVQRRLDLTDLDAADEGSSTEAVRRIFDVMGEIERAFPDVDFDATTPRVRWIRNPHAAVTLPDVFQGPHDGLLDPYN